MRAETTIESVAAGGASLWTASSGPADGVGMALCHGGPGLCDNLGAMAAMVDDLARVHRYDQRGCGRSPAPGPYGAAGSIADLEALRAHWGHERWIVGGHSWGAGLALRYALAHPERTLGVVYTAGGGLEFGRFARERGLARNARLTDEERGELSQLIAMSPSDMDRAGPMSPGDIAGVDQAGVDERFDRLVWITDFADRTTAFRVLDGGPLYAYRRNEAVARQSRLSVAGEDAEALAAGVKALQAPLLIIHGAHDVPEQVRPLVQLAPRARLLELARSAHLPWLEEPAAVRMALRQFVADAAAD